MPSSRRRTRPGGWTRRRRRSQAASTCSPTLRASTTTRRYGAKGRRCFGRPLAAAQAGKAWTPLRSLSLAERRRPARRDAVGAPADAHRGDGPQCRASPATRGTGGGDLECAGGGRAGGAARSGEVASRGEAAARGTRWAEDDRWWRAAWREVETAHARVLQIARLVSGGPGRSRYPEVLLVEHSPLLMELLYRQDPADALRCSPTAHKMPCSRDSVSCEKRNLWLTSSCAKRNL